MDPIFVHTRYDYDSYTDYWRLVELSGFQRCYHDEIDFQSTNTYIVSPMNGNYREHIANHLERRCTILHWLLERPGGSGTFARFTADNRELVERHFVDGVIVSDVDMARATGFKYVPMGSHAGLGMPGDRKDFDAIGLMCYSDRRAFLFSNPSYVRTRLESGLTQAPNAWGAERDDLLKRTRIGINVHQDPFNYCEPLRFALFAAYGLPIVTETISERNVYGNLVVSCAYDKFMQVLRWARSRYDFLYARMGLDLRAELCGPQSFRACLERYL